MGEQYFAEDPGAASRPGTVDLVLPDLHLRLATDSGVFSPSRIDPGTRVLLETVPPPPALGTFLDLGCGYGPIALALASRAPGADVWGVDVNERALELARRNAASAHLDKVRFVRADTFDATAGPHTRLDLIWSNPPIRIGKAPLHDLLASWLGRLSPTGRAYLVVQKHLGSDSLQRWLAGAGHPTRRLASRAAYRVLEVSASPDQQETDDR